MTFIGWLIILFMTSLILYGINKDDAIKMVILIVLIFFQNIIIILVSPYIGKTDYTIIILMKEIFILLVLMLKSTKKIFFNKLAIYSICAIFFLCIYTLTFNNGTVIGTLASLRQLYLPFLFYFFGYTLHINKKKFKNIICFFVLMCVISVIFGFFELYQGDSFWERLGMQYYTLIKYNQTFIIKNYYTYNSLYSWDFITITGDVVQRIGSFLADAVILGQLLALGLLFCIFDNLLFAKKYIYFFIVLCFMGLLFTIAKGGYLIFILSTNILLNKVWGKKILSYFLTFISILIISFLIIFSIKYDLSGFAHFNGLIEPIIKLPNHPFGTGIGSEGNIAANFGNTTVENSGESFIGTVIGQMGLPGLIMFMGFFYYLLFNRNYLRYEDKEIRILFEILHASLWALFISCFINNTAISFTSCFMYFIPFGMHIKEKEIKKT